MARFQDYIPAQYRAVYQETVATMAAGGTFTSTARLTNDFGELRVIVNTDQAGTLYVDEGYSSTAFVTTKTAGFASGCTLKKATLGGNYGRIRYVTGGTTSVFELITSFTPIGQGEAST